MAVEESIGFVTHPNIIGESKAYKLRSIFMKEWERIGNKINSIDSA